MALAALCLLAAGPAAAQLKPPAPAASSPAEQPIDFEADSMRGTLERGVVLEGNVRLSRPPMKLQADRVEYSNETGIARALGNIHLQMRGDQYTGTEAALQVQRDEGYILNPTFRFERTQAGGTAKRIDLLGENRFSLTDTTYTSCPPDPSGDRADPPWILTTRRVQIDFDANEGTAESAVVRFYGVPILAAPVLSFPVTDARKSGWLPPNLDLSNTRGFEVGVPYYWNIAPNRDATITPTVSTRRGAGIETEFRYLEPRWEGEAGLVANPHDQAAGRSRWAARWKQDGRLPGQTYYDWDLLRVSDDNYWKDGMHGASSLTPRLLSSQAEAKRRGRVALGDSELGSWTVYADAQSWQVLQDPDPQARIEAPYRREPRLGARQDGRFGALDWSLETEFNRFTHEDPLKIQGSRVHAVASGGYRFGTDGWNVTPRVSLNTAAYDTDRPMLDGRMRASRSIPTFSLDSAWTFERDAVWRDRPVLQTLEPRLQYVRTPYVSQSALPDFDSAGVDFNFTSIFFDNSFSGVDRVSDANQVTAGLTTRLIDAQTGAESARFGVAQRYLLSDELITPDGVPLTRRFSDLLLMGSTTAIPRWTLDGTVQYSPENGRISRTIASARYSPGPFRTINAAYRLVRDSSEQLAVGWQWPLTGRDGLFATRPSAKHCTGTVYSAGRVDYSMRDRRITDSILGLEYDAGCWIGRIVAERNSTGLNQATNKLSIQLELIGLSRLALGSNPLRLLKDNIPGYQLLRSGSQSTDSTPAAQP